MLFGVFFMMLYTFSNQEEKMVENWLKETLLQPGEFHGEVQKFIRRHIITLEVPETADEWQKKSSDLRQEILDKIVFHGIPSEWHKDEPEIIWGNVINTDKGYVIRKLRYEALPGLWLPALLYEPEKIDGKAPGILNVNGHVGPPGKTQDYEQIRCINLAKRGIIAIHPEWLVFGELSGDDYKHNRLAYLDLCGSCGLSVFYLAMKRGIDVLTMYPKVDSERIAMTGLSGGGWQTIILSSLDTRISATAPNAGYIGMECRTVFPGDIGDLEQNPNDLLTIGDYTHLTAMLAPRPSLIICNEKDDCCFQSYRARASVYDPVVPFFDLFGKAGDFYFHDNKDPGTHNYDKDNREQFYKFINKYFMPESKRIDPEIPSDDEVLSYDDLIVGIPENNANFYTLASQLMKELPRNQYSGKESLDEWQANAKQRLKDVLRVNQITVKASVEKESSDGDIKSKFYRFSMNDELSMPVVTVSKSSASNGSVAILCADNGKSSLIEQIDELVNNGSVVIAVDPFFMGECVPEGSLWQYAQMVSAVGERSLGIQAAQLGGVIEWACQEFGADKVSLYATGWNAGIAILCAGGLHNDKIRSVNVKDCPESLKLLVENHTDYETYPALFCFGLLEQFDVKELITLCLPAEVNVASVR